ncbi:MAG: FAD-dependent oxidoreductase [Firmicutes bacterium]|nr:FAD-dependent oxidoreductase [Bacillota bacterium]
MIRITINGINIEANEGESILSVATRAGVDIPTFCHDDRVATYGSCGICIVEVSTSPRLLRACSTLAADGMVITTDTERVRNNRKIALELLLSDHKGDCLAPCMLACPGETDCKGYVGLIAGKKYQEATALMRDKLPLPSSIGRVCPHPCEDKCRRNNVEEPINIASLKFFASDKCIGADAPLPEILPSTGKRVAVVGGGPGGLTAAYFLRRQGHKVTIFDAMPKMGGMLRYGIPEYRLPKRILNREIAFIKRMGVMLKNNVKLGQDMTLEELRKKYHAVVLAIGAWNNVKLKCAGEDLGGVIGGIEFLRAVAKGEPIDIGKSVAIVGGGNTAMDACRTAVRLGADNVYNIYRRTRNEMPAQKIEIDEAEEEGVIFKNLTNPIEIVGNGGKVQKIRLQKMKLGEPDASGRRSPVPLVGEEEVLEVDTVIIAIGQVADTKGLDGIELTKWGTINADKSTYMTNMDKVFAIGDATNKGADIAIAAIGEGRRVAEVIDCYLKSGKVVGIREPYLAKTEPDKEDFADQKKKSRVKMKHLPPENRRTNFKQVSKGYTEAQAVKEARRCLECGCKDFLECKLVDYANRYDVKPQKYGNDMADKNTGGEIANVEKTPDKCILCGLCVRICDEVVGAGILGLEGRGFDTTVSVRFGSDCPPETCVDCGKCAEVCPTGALIKE